MAELEECVEEVVFGSQAFMRRWGTDVRDLLARTPEWRDYFSFRFYYYYYYYYVISKKSIT